MFKIFYDSLFKPKNIVNHVDSEPKRKFIGFLILTLLLLIIPSSLINIFSNKFTNEENEKIIGEIKKVDPILYKIVDNKLVYTGSGPSQVQHFIVDKNDISITSLNMKVKCIYFLFSLDYDNVVLSNIEDTCYIVLLSEEKVDIIYHQGVKKVNGAVNLASNENSNDLVIKTIKYECSAVNFNYTEVEDKYLYSTNVYNFCSLIYNQLDTKYVMIMTLYVASNLVMNLLLSIVVTIAILGLFFRFMGVPFGKVIKITFLSYTPYVIGTLLSICFGSYLLSALGEMIALFYTYRTMKTYSLLKLLLDKK